MNSRTLVNPSRLPAGAIDLGDGRVGYGLLTHEVSSLEVLLRRYYAWEASGRRLDPWASGVGQAQRYDQARVVTGPPPGGYGPGTASPSEHDPALEQMAVQYARLTLAERCLLEWSVRDRETLGTIAERLDVSWRKAAAMLRRARVRLWYRLV